MVDHLIGIGVDIVGVVLVVSHTLGVAVRDRNVLVVSRRLIQVGSNRGRLLDRREIGELLRDLLSKLNRE